MSCQDADAYQQQGQEVKRLCRLQQDIDEDAERQENKEMQITAGTYLIFVTCHQAVNGAYYEQQEQIAQCSDFPYWEVP